MAVVIGNNFSNTIFGTNFNDRLEGRGGNDFFRGFAGNDLIIGGSGIDTADYSFLGRAMTIGPGGIINKNGLGFDRLIGVERVVGAQGFANWIDGQGGNGNAAFNVNLAANRLTVNGLPGIGGFSFSAFNFVNVRGTNNNDTIAGNFQNNILRGEGGRDVLTGRGGNDILIGGSGVDRLNGTDSSARGNQEFDQLIGGFGTDIFVLGDRTSSFYRNGGFNDFARILDFSANDLIQLGARDIYRAVADAQGFNLFVARNGGFDLIADVQTNAFIPLPGGNFRLASGQQFGNFIGA